MTTAGVEGTTNETASSRQQGSRSAIRSYTFVDAGSPAKKRRVALNNDESDISDKPGSGATAADRGMTAVDEDFDGAPVINLFETITRPSQVELPPQEPNDASEFSQLGISSKQDAEHSTQPRLPHANAHDSTTVSDLSSAMSFDMSSTVSGDAWDIFSGYFDTMLNEPSELQFPDLLDFAPVVMQNLSPNSAMNLITEAIGPQHAWLLEKCLSLTISMAYKNDANVVHQTILNFVFFQ